MDPCGAAGIRRSSFVRKEPPSRQTRMHRTWSAVRRARRVVCSVSYAYRALSVARLGVECCAFWRRVLCVLALSVVRPESVMSVPGAQRTLTIVAFRYTKVCFPRASRSALT